MKRKISKMLLALFLILLIPFGTVSAEENNVGKKPILEIIAETERANIPDDDLIYYTDAYIGEMKGNDYSDTLIFKCYSLTADSNEICGAFKAAKYLPGETVKNDFSKYEFYYNYAVMAENPFVAGWNTYKDDEYYEEKSDNGTYYVTKYNGENTVKCFKALEDIRSNAVYESKLNPENVRYTDVICFQAPPSYVDWGMVVYYISGDNNSLVYYYPDHDSEAIQFTLLDFKTYGTQFDAFMRTDEYEKRVPWSGGSYEFFDYLEEFHPEMVEGSTVPNPPVSYPDEENSASIPSNEDSSEIKPWVLIVCTVGAFVLGAIAAILIKNKKKQ